MNEHDRMLVGKARRMEWGDVARMVGDAETEEGRAALHRMAVNGYHREELVNGML